MDFGNIGGVKVVRKMISEVYCCGMRFLLVYLLKKKIFFVLFFYVKVIKIG